MIRSHMFSHQGDVESVDLLLKHGCPVSHTDKFGLTALHVAAAKGSFECVNKLTELTKDDINKVIFISRYVCRCSTNSMNYNRPI